MNSFFKQFCVKLHKEIGNRNEEPSWKLKLTWLLVNFNFKKFTKNEFVSMLNSSSISTKLEYISAIKISILVDFCSESTTLMFDLKIIYNKLIFFVQND